MELAFSVKFIISADASQSMLERRTSCMRAVTSSADKGVGAGLPPVSGLLPEAVWYGVNMIDLVIRRLVCSDRHTGASYKFFLVPYSSGDHRPAVSWVFACRF